jgi:hypothetical protein
MTPNPIPARPAPKTASHRGCLVALACFAGVLLVSCLAGGFFVWRAADTKAGRQALGVVGKGLDLAFKGAHAPGTEALRKAGCEGAFVAE